MREEEEKERQERKKKKKKVSKILNNRNAPRCSYYDFSKSSSARTEFNEHKLIQLVSGCPASLPVSTRALPPSMDLYETNRALGARVKPYVRLL